MSCNIPVSAECFTRRQLLRAEKRGYDQGPIKWQSNKKQKYKCSPCKRTFARMDILLQHFRDSSRHMCVSTLLDAVRGSRERCLMHCRQEPISREASIQMSNWLLAKDLRQPCCPVCCLGFKTDIELFVHLKHTKVHEVSTACALCMAAKPDLLLLIASFMTTAFAGWLCC